MHKVPASGKYGTILGLARLFLVAQRSQIWLDFMIVQWCFGGAAFLTSKGKYSVG